MMQLSPSESDTGLSRLRLVVRVLLLGALLMSPRLWAMPMDYTFDVNFTSGPLASTSASVAVVLNGITGVGSETFLPYDGSLQSFDFVFGVDVFDMSAAFDSPFEPVIMLANGELTGVSFLGSGSMGGLAEITDTSTSYTPNVGDPSQGLTVLASWRSPGEVPIPPTLALFAIGLLAMRRRTTA